MLHKYAIEDIITTYTIGLAGVSYFDAVATACSTGRASRVDKPAMAAALCTKKRKRR